MTPERETAIDQLSNAEKLTGTTYEQLCFFLSAAWVYAALDIAAAIREARQIGLFPLPRDESD